MIKLRLTFLVALVFTAYSLRAVDYTPADIGTSTTGDILNVLGGYAVTGGGAGITGRTDQFHFGYEERTGDFDMRARVAALSITDPFAQAGLMARASLDANGQFVGIFASSAALGCFFESRNTPGAPAQTAAPAGGFPVNYPQTWLRLRRSGNQFTGYGSFDGTAWQTLGDVSLTLPAKLFFGMAVSSQNTNTLATAQFRDVGRTTTTSTFTYTPEREPLGPSSRRTGLVFSEIMYHPPTRSDGKDLEFIELYNAESLFMDLTGWRLSGAVKYAFPSGFKLQAGQFVTIAADPAALESTYGIQGVLGPYTDRLNNAGDTLRLLNGAGAVRLEVEYSPNAPWPISADGTGHSLVLARPSYGENDARAWSASERPGGTPGELEAITANPWSGVVINEFLAHTDDPELDFVELYNTHPTAVDISGCFLTDSVSTNRFRVPDGTIVQPGGFVSFDQNHLGFALNSAGETIYFVAANDNRVLDAIRFGGQENGVSSGRSPDGSSTIRRLTMPTPSAANAQWRSENIVINEIMYHPISDNDDDQYVELHNRSSDPIDLSGWRFESGIDFQFPAGTTIAPAGYVVVAKNAVRVRSKYSQLNEANTLGDFDGNLSKSGEYIALSKPDTVVSIRSDGTMSTNRIHIIVSEVNYVDGGSWPALADGGGSSLELIDSRADLLRAANWAASDETQKAPWTTAEVTGRLALGASGQSANRFYILARGASECLVDDVQVFVVGSTNLLANGGFENGTSGWSLFGNHSGSDVDSTGAASGQSCLHLRAPGDGDTGINSVRANLTSTLRSSQTVTIRAKVRWLSGWPEILFRVRGNWIEMPVRMNIPESLGTPGKANSRRVSNAEPAIFEVTHTPPLPAANAPVVVTCRVSDPDGVAEPQLRFRIDPATTYTTVSMRDDGSRGDALAGDGVYSATIPGRSSGTLAAFYIRASDDASPSATRLYPSDAPTRECLIRWNDTIPFGTFAHYHLWNTRATDTARSRSKPLDNTYRDSTLVYGNFRVIYNAGFRDKGSPYHGGSGDFAVTVPKDDLLLGTNDRVFGSTGNGGDEATRIRGDVSGWIGEQMGIPFLHSHFMRLYRNGQAFRQILYDLEQPNRSYASSWFGGGGKGDELYKIAVWFEFDDSSSSFTATGATLQRFLSGSDFSLARYRWNWQPRPSGMTVDNYTPIFNLSAAANNSADRVTGMSNLADMEQWMRVFAFNRVLGNWDAWTFNVGQNMYLYSKSGGRATLLPWDIDFVLGLGNGTSDALWGGQDPVMNQVFNVPAYRRMLWRAFQDAAAGPMQPENYGPQIDARRAALLNNEVTGASDPQALKTYLDGRRRYIESQLLRNDTQTFSVTSNGGSSFSTSNPLAQIAGTAPFAVATIEINGIPYPVDWTGFTTWRISVPMGTAINNLNIVGRDLRGQVVPGATANLTVRYNGTVPQPEDWIVFNEIMYNPLEKNAEFIELLNRHPSTTFDLSGFRISGLNFELPAGTFIDPNGYLIFTENKSAFASTYGATIPIAGEYSGKLDNGGETLRLIKPGAAEADDRLIDSLRYDNLPPWPTAADGTGPSLQLIDPAQDNWRVGNWAITDASNANRHTPGRANAVRAALNPFPPIWINEVLPDNLTGTQDNQGEHEPWIELYNAGSAPLDLSDLYLSNDSANLLQWQIPRGTSLGAGRFLVVWADGEPSESTPAAPHTNFRLQNTTGLVILSRLQQGSPAAIDYVRYSVTSPDRGFGAIIDGNPQGRRLIFFPTPGTPNNGASPTLPVFINEWMANNQSTRANPVDGQFDDWFELYNAGVTNVDLSGFYLTDDLVDKTQFRIPDGTILTPGGFRVFWADNKAGQNDPGTDLHTSFSLSTHGGQIGLFGPDGNSIDEVTYSTQAIDISEGRLPDGGEPPFLAFAIATPGTPNISEVANRPPTLDPIADRTITEGQRLAFRVIARDLDTPAQTLSFSLVNSPESATLNPATGEFAWVPSESQGPGTHSITVRVTDNGLPARSASRIFTVVVQESNLPPSLGLLEDITVDEGTLVTVQAAATDPDQPAQALVFSLDPGAPAGAFIDPVTGLFEWSPSENQGPATHTITVRVADDGNPPLTTVRALRIVVREINNAPEITPVSPQTIDEGATLRIPVIARDSDTPPAPLAYSLDNSPVGASIDPNTGVFTWTPSEADGPHDYNVTVRVNEPGGAPNATMSFLIGVNEVNTPPVMEPIQDFTVRAGDLLSFTVRASDQDLPAQSLLFSATTPLPQGATLDPLSGIFSWPVPEDPREGSFELSVQATDDAIPPLSVEQTFHITVNAPPRIAINEIMHRPSTSGARYVELANYSSANPIDLTGWRLDGYDYVFPSGTILAPNGFLCVAENSSAFRTAYGDQVRVMGNATITVAPPGGLLRLFKTGIGTSPDVIMDEVRFGLQPPWPAAAINQGASLQLIDPRQDHRRVGNWAASVGSVTNQPETVVPIAAIWKYWQNASSPGVNWADPGFNDTAWPSGKALLYVENANLAATKGTALTLGRTTYYFRTRFNFSGNPQGAKILLNTYIDDGAVIYLNGREIFRLGMAGGNVTQSTFASRTVGDAALEGPFEAPADDLVQGENVLAVEVHQTNSTSSDIVLGVTADVISVTAASFTPGAPNSLTANLDPFPLVWINELLPVQSTGLVDNAGDSDPWIELFNGAPSAQRMSGWSLTDDYSVLDKWMFPSPALIPGMGFGLVWADAETSEATPGNLHTNFRLNANGGSVALARVQNGQRVIVDHVDYPALVPGQSFGAVIDGHTVERQLFVIPTPNLTNNGVSDEDISLEVTLPSTGQVTLAWNTQPGARYRLEAAASLSNPQWTTVFDAVATTTSQAFDDVVTASNRFYRLVKE